MIKDLLPIVLPSSPAIANTFVSSSLMSVRIKRDRKMKLIEFCPA